MNISQIRTFLTLADCLNMTETAARLNCTQPAISARINSLEESLNTPLFDRIGKKIHLTANGVDVLGPTHHGIFQSIYFFDPNGHRVELACDIGTDDQYAELRRVAPLMLEEWSRTKKAPRHADWLHQAANE